MFLDISKSPAMSDFNHLYNPGQPGLYLSPDQEDALLTALSSNTPTDKSGNQDVQAKIEPRESLSHGHSPQLQAPGSGHFDFGTDQSPFLDFGLDVDFDADDADNLIGDLPGMPSRRDVESRDKRKSMDEKDEDDEGGRKRRESEGAKKPGRKPLTAEPTSVGSLSIPNFAYSSLHAVSGTHIKQYCYVYRNGRPKTVLPSVLSENARRST